MENNDIITSPLDGSYLLPSERTTPNNVSMLKAFNGNLADILAYMEDVQTAVYNYETGQTSKIILNPADIQSYIGKIRDYCLNMGGGYADDGTTVKQAQAANLIPDLLMTLRDNQLVLCQLYAVSQDSQQNTVGPLDDVVVEDTTDAEGAGEI